MRETQWHSGTDVIVVGYGAAGAVAAITAHDNGANVIILERQPSDSHTSTSHMSAGIFISPVDTKVTKEYLETLCSANIANKEMLWTKKELIKVWAEYSCQNKEWVESHGGEVKLQRGSGSHREIPGNELMRLCYLEGRGQGLMKFLDGLVRQRNIEVRYGARARRLLRNSQGAVSGVAVWGQEGQDINVKARKAVILCTGGFEFDEDMKLQFLRCYPCYFSGSPANTGDGVRMAMGAGADLWHMNCFAAGFVMKFPEIASAFAISLRGARGREADCGYVIIDKKGKRFTNENFKIHHVSYELATYDTRALEFPRVPSYWVIDQTRVAAGPLAALDTGPAGPAGSYSWSKDNSAELQRGWLTRADTIGQLEGCLEIPKGNLCDTVDRYNGYCGNHDDLEFRRRRESLVPLDNPPYYAVKIWPGGANTQGGPRRNEKSQVIDVEGRAIPALYAAGELGSMFGMLYTGGGNLGECISSGRIAGEHAAKESER